MKKILALLIAGMMMISLAACGESTTKPSNVPDNTASDTGNHEEQTTENISTDAPDEGNRVGIDLEYDFQHVNDKIYYAHMSIGNDDEVTEFDESEPNFVRIENAADNFVLDIHFLVESKEAYAQSKTTAKEENKLYEETTFGKYNGYYSDDNGDIYGYILFDESDSTFNVFVMFLLYLNDEMSDNNDIQMIFESSQIQSILNNIEFESK